MTWFFWLILAAIVAAIAAALDFSFVRIWWDAIGIGYARIGQSVAAGLLGEASFTGGIGTALLGTVLHFAIMLAFVLFYLFAADRFPFLRRHPVASAVGYGLATFVLMNFVVVPLSGAAHPIKLDVWFLASIGAHIAFVGFGAVLAERWVNRNRARAT